MASDAEQNRAASNRRGSRYAVRRVGGRDRYLTQTEASDHDLRAALKPFADAAKMFEPYSPEMNCRVVECAFTLGQLRAAAAALGAMAGRAPPGDIGRVAKDARVADISRVGDATERLS